MGRLAIDVHYQPTANEELAADTLKGLGADPKWLHPKYLYDKRGSQLFDAICGTQEYYPTRTEYALLRGIAPELLKSAAPDTIVELGSGAARKTRVLLDAAQEADLPLHYVPLDVSESMLRATANELMAEYPELTVHGLVADYTQQLDILPRDGRRLFLFLGSTLGNFEPDSARDFLRQIAREMAPGDTLLLGTDLVKPAAVLNAAYNDAAGLTAAFNTNLLTMLNRELQSNFQLAQFEHQAQFVQSRSQVEMRLRSMCEQEVEIPAIREVVRFAAGETILTEISRKFTRESVRCLLGEAGLDLAAWHTPENRYFGLSLARLRA